MHSTVQVAEKNWHHAGQRPQRESKSRGTHSELPVLLNRWQSAAAPHSASVVHAAPQRSGATHRVSQVGCVRQIGVSPPQPLQLSGKHAMVPAVVELQWVPAEHSESAVQGSRQVLGVTHSKAH